MTLKFSDLNLDPKLASAIEKLGYQETTPIQTAVIPQVMNGKDISGLAQTGTGKTAAFLIPIMDRILKGQIQDWAPSNFILILVPTRELAEQVAANVFDLGEPCGLKGIAVYGGTGYDKQKEAFRQNVDFVVATPGRLIDLYKDNCVDLKQVRAVVFDEADRESIGRLEGNLRWDGIQQIEPTASVTNGLPSIGVSFLKHFCVVFHEPERKVWLCSDDQDPVASPTERSIGLSMILDTDGWRVVGVIPGSPAEAGFIKIGNHLTQIEGAPARTWTRDEIRHWIDSHDKVALVVADDSGSRSINLRVWSLVP